MKSRWANFVKDYLSFSRKERRGVCILLFLTVLVFFISRYFPVTRKHVDNGAFQKELAQLRIFIDTSRDSYVYDREDNAEKYRPKHYTNYSRLDGELFAFDPNTLDADGWKRLGVRDKTVHTIQNFIAKGYRFRQPADLRKIYGLRPQDADRLIPYVRIAEKDAFTQKNTESVNYATFVKKPDSEVFRTKVIDINAADTTEFISLPGIGSKLATRIVNFRQKLGGFSSVNQLGETYGLADSTFQKIRARLQCNNTAVKKLNINTADANELKTHPYIRWNIANAIVNYRSQHGAYKTVDDLRKIEIIDDGLFNKIAPYLVL